MVNNYNIREFLVLMILSTLMLANLFMVVGSPADSGSRIIGIVWLIATILFIVIRPIKPMTIGYKYFLAILIVSIFLGILKMVATDFNDIDIYLYNLLYKSIPKILFLMCIYYLIANLDRINISTIVYKYSIMFILTIVLALGLYKIIPMHRFVMYGERFAALHYELVNFSYTFFTVGIILLYSYFKSKTLLYLGIALLSVLVYKVSLSNYVPLFLGSVIFSLLLLNTPIKVRKVLYLSYFIFLITILLALPNVLEYLESYLYLFPRSSAALTDNNPIFIRLYRHIFAMQYFFENIFNLPYGFFNGGIDADLTDINSWSGGSGLSKLFMDLGLLVIPFLILVVQTCLKVLSRVNVHNRTDQMFFILMNLSIAYSYLQAGFFNFTVFAIFLLSIRYWKII